MDHFANVDNALKAVSDARKVIRRGTSRQIGPGDERDHMRTVATLWFQHLKKQISPYADGPLLQATDDAFRRVLDATAKAAARTTYDNALGDARTALLNLRAAMPVGAIYAVTQYDDDTAPNFTPLAFDPRMQSIMERRWRECIACLNAGAYLAAVIMMGGLLESLFVSKQNRLTDKSPLLNAARRPQVKGKTVPLQEWTLNHYIEVGNELGWIGDAGKAVSVALRDYRNFVHPQKEYALQPNLGEQDARLLWSITKALIRELLTGSN